MDNAAEDVFVSLFNLADELLDQIWGELTIRDLISLYRTSHTLSSQTARALQSVRIGNENEDGYRRRFVISQGLAQQLQNPANDCQYVMVGSLHEADGEHVTFERAELKVESGGGAQMYVFYDHTTCGSLISQEDIWFQPFDERLVFELRYGFMPNGERVSMSVAFLQEGTVIEFNSFPAFTTISGDIELRIQHNNHPDAILVLRDSTRAVPYNGWHAPLQNWLPPGGGCWRRGDDFIELEVLPDDIMHTLAENENIFYRETNPRDHEPEPAFPSIAYSGDWEITRQASDFFT